MSDEPGSWCPGTRVWWTWPLPSYRTDGVMAEVHRGVVVEDQDQDDPKTVTVIDTDTGHRWELRADMNLNPL